MFYVKLSNELKDLARLRLALNLLNGRQVLEFKKLVPAGEAVTKMSEEEKKISKRDEVFTFKDPLLRHFNSSFQREEL